MSEQTHHHEILEELDPPERGFAEFVRLLYPCCAEQILAAMEEQEAGE